MRELYMKKKIKIINGDRVTLTNDNSDFSDDLPEELDFSSLKEIENPIKSMIMLDDDVAKYFKNSSQVNAFLRNQINLFRKVVV